MPERNQWMGVLPVAARGGVCFGRKANHPRGPRFVDVGSGHRQSGTSPVDPQLHRWPYDPQPRREAVRLGLASPEGLRSSRQDLQLKSNLVSDPRALHDQLLTLNPYGRAAA